MKYHNGFSMRCGHCEQTLFPLYLTENKKHTYNPGQLFVCNYDCKKSRVWTNSVRNAELLLKFFEGEESNYLKGWCNDSFCGYCFRYIQPLQNGFSYMGGRYDLFGCEYCEPNQLIITDVRLKTPENDHKRLFDWYKRKIDDLKKYLAD